MWTMPTNSNFNEKSSFLSKISNKEDILKTQQILQIQTENIWKFNQNHHNQFLKSFTTNSSLSGK